MPEESWSTTKWLATGTDVKVGDVIEIEFGNKTVKVRVTMIADSTKKEDAKDMFEYV